MEYRSPYVVSFVESLVVNQIIAIRYEFYLCLTDINIVT